MIVSLLSRTILGTGQANRFGIRTDSEGLQTSLYGTTLDFPSMKPTSSLRISLVCSYSHKDESFRSSMEKSIALLKKFDSLDSWSDRKILPGQPIAASFRKKLEIADIVVFLLSQNFIASNECMREWEECKRLCDNSETIQYRVPIILSKCAWKDLLRKDGDDIKALPNDGKPVESYASGDEAWHQVYEGIKQVVEQLKNDFSPKQNFLTQLEQSYFASQDHEKLTDLFVFPTLTCLDEDFTSSRKITQLEQLRSVPHVLLHGEEVSGKSALAQYIVIKFIEQNSPVLFANLADIQKHATEQTFLSIYRKSFNGDYHKWKKQSNKTLVLDDLTSDPRSIQFVDASGEFFDNIVVTTTSDVYRSYFWDDHRLAKYQKYEIEPLTHVHQEQLIRKRLNLARNDCALADGDVDAVEQRVNSVINNRIVPRYPFYVLTVIQTFEAFSPENFSITKHGHCYQIFTLAQLMKAGISEQDEDLNTCINFCEHLALCIYNTTLSPNRKFLSGDFDKFLIEYRSRFILKDSILSRIKNEETGILTEDRNFRIPYMYYYFLGKRLAKPSEQEKSIIEHLCECSHVRGNQLTLLFIIHHAVDESIIELIQLYSMCAIDFIQPAELRLQETQRFRDVIEALQQSFLSDQSVEAERKHQRERRDVREEREVADNELDRVDDDAADVVNDTYRILKNNELLGYILQSQYGRLERSRIEEIIETIANGGLRLVNALLSSDDEIAELARYVHKVYPEKGLDQIKKALTLLSFLWTMHNIEAIVKAVRHRNISELVSNIAKKKQTPAYDIFARLIMRARSPATCMTSSKNCWKSTMTRSCRECCQLELNSI